MYLGLLQRFNDVLDSLRAHEFEMSKGNNLQHLIEAKATQVKMSFEYGGLTRRQANDFLLLIEKKRKAHHGKRFHKNFDWLFDSVQAKVREIAGGRRMKR